ncbi:unnamed protein product [Albugo candida]|uniref:Uncharacterized protein n=1 Tax=Albugo candida TaxID=65357 RepID=A0A024FVS0_9STRA|nr:unnamed protein product [Albugo candida]|eukprot:CCI11268.1 unnamed protein product [Albugo candida]
MQEIQECGHPPAEIVKELAPGLQFDANGMPELPNVSRHTLSLPMLKPVFTMHIESMLSPMSGLQGLYASIFREQWNHHDCITGFCPAGGQDQCILM